MLTSLVKIELKKLVWIIITKDTRLIIKTNYTTN